MGLTLEAAGVVEAVMEGAATVADSAVVDLAGDFGAVDLAAVDTAVFRAEVSADIPAAVWGPRRAVFAAQAV